MKRIGFLVNPIAGLGGQAGMKGSDSLDGRMAALGLGYSKTAGARAYECITRIREEAGFHMIAPEGEMGGNILEEAQIPYESIGKHGEITSKEDTLYYARLMKLPAASCGVSARDSLRSSLVCYAASCGELNPLWD